MLERPDPEFMKLTGKLTRNNGDLAYYVIVPRAEFLSGDEFGEGEYFIKAHSDKTGNKFWIGVENPAKQLLLELSNIIYYNLVISAHSVAMDKTMMMLGFEPDDIPSKDQLYRALEQKL